MFPVRVAEKHNSKFSYYQNNIFIVQLWLPCCSYWQNECSAVHWPEKNKRLSRSCIESDPCELWLMRQGTLWVNMLFLFASRTVNIGLKETLVRIQSIIRQKRASHIECRYSVKRLNGIIIKGHKLHKRNTGATFNLDVLDH